MSQIGTAQVHDDIVDGQRARFEENASTSFGDFEFSYRCDCGFQVQESDDSLGLGR
jgi:hypothetical protein